MNAFWQIFEHHLALKDGNNIYHPSASDIYSFDGNCISGIHCSHPNEDLPELKFSSVGIQPYIKLTNDSNGNISIYIHAKKRGIDIEADIIEGNLIDQCVFENKWYFLTRSNEIIQDILSYAEIKRPGKISLKQYIRIVEKGLSAPFNTIENLIDSTALNKPIVKDTDIPFGLKANLYPYQKDGFQWIKTMLEINHGCILGDEMGLGKTMQIITEILYLKNQDKVPVLVVAPISLLTNWQRECKKFAPSITTLIHHGSERVSNYKDFLYFDVIITSYTTVVSDIHLLNMINWQLVVLDEAQNIKNPYSARTKACKGLKRQRSLAVSGTPFENHISDIWSLLDFIQPDVLGSLQTFESSISDDVDGGKKIEPILSALMVRRLVANVAQDLPDKIVTTQALQMSEFEIEQYNNFLSQLKESYDTTNPNLGMLQQLRIFCTHPDAVIQDLCTKDPADNSVKYQRFCEIVEEIVARNEKVIIFTSFKKMFDIFLKDVPNRFGIKSWAINGETPVEQRQQIVDKFNNLNSSAALFLNPRAAGTGLNITSANHVIHYNLEWNPSLEDQSSARAYRRGQCKTVFVYRLYYTNTVEQIVNERIERKRDIAASAIIGNDGQSQDRADIIRALEMIPSIKNSNN